MTFLVDANVLCEATKPVPAPHVLEWLRKHESELVVDPIILGEIRYGIHLLPAGKRRQRLELWFQDGIQCIECVPWDSVTGLCWAKLLADLRVHGKSMPVKDSMIAATALVHGLTVATRNTRDFRRARVKVVDPFRSR